jgi:tetratricopeptide (TPR) repeat protein
MKKINLFVVSTVALAMGILSACTNIGSMQKRMADFNAKVNPDPLEVHGDTVAVSISGKFPPKFFAKKVSVVATPVLIYGSSEVKFKDKQFRGEAAPGNGDVVPFEAGKSFTYNDKIAYAPSMLSSELKLRIAGTQGSKSASLPEVSLAKGVITTSYLVNKLEGKVMSSSDKFVRSTSNSFEAEVLFDYNSDKIRPAELKDKDIAALVEFLSKTMPANPRMKITNIEVQSYASPEGEIFLNNDLATGRGDAGKSVLVDLLKKNKLDAQYASLIQLNPKGEDWAGFKSAMEKSAIEDKDLIIRVLQRTTDLEAREQEIKNISKTYQEIEKVIFPGLRRAIIRVNYTLEGYSDQELKAMASNPSSLKYEELMKAGSLVTDLNTQVAVYKEATLKSEADYRAYNNLGVAYYNQGKTNEAKTQFEKAYTMTKNAETACNFGLVTRLGGDMKKASALLNESGSSEAKFNMGVAMIMAGNYGAAINNMGNNKTFNTALAKCLNKDFSGAKADLDACNNDNNSAMGYYLRAVVGARLNDANMVKESLAKAIEKDAKLAEKSASDLEFRNFQGK